jgi:hypothetical protein
MGEAGLPGLLVFGADVIPDIDRDNGSFMVFMNNQR